MRRKLGLLLILIVSGLLPKLKAQPVGSLQQYYYWADNAVTFAPIASYQFDNSWYLEGRYNYEEIKAYSVYVGKTFEKNTAFSYTFTPIAGVVFGTYKGGSIGANVYLEYKNFYLSSQPQYTASSDGKENNFLYSWSDIGYQITDWLGAGLSFQHTKSYQTKGLLEKGFLLELSVKNWAFPLYVYNPESENRYFLVGVNFEWEGRERKKKQVEKTSSHKDIMGQPLQQIKPL